MVLNFHGARGGELGFPSGFSGGSNSKESACNARDLGSITGLGRFPAGGHGNPFQYSCLENSHGQRSLVGYSPWGHKESDTTEVTCHSRVQHSTTNLSANSLNFLPYWYSSPLLNQKWKYVNLLYNSCQWLFFEPIHNPPHFKTPFFPMYLPQDKV